MKFHAAAVSLLVLGLLFHSEVVLGQTQADSAGSLAGMNQSLQEIASLLREQNANQRSSLLLHRLEIESNGLDRLEASLREERSQRDSLSAELVVFKERFQEEESRLYREVADQGVDDVAAQVREQLGFAETELMKLQEAFKLEGAYGHPT